MNKTEYLDMLSDTVVDKVKVDKVQSVFGREVSETVQKIVSCSEDTVFFDDGYRTLSINEIINADEQLHAQFTENGLVPLIDCGDNDFIVYNAKDNNWSKYNIVDDVVFKIRETFEELFI